MKHYLELIPISSRVHARQHRMTLLCIALSVFLVTTIFSMADMEVRSQTIQALHEYGNWHIQLSDITGEDAALIAARPKVAAMSWYDILNYRLDEGYAIDGRQAAICGIEPPLLTDIMTMADILEGSYPGDGEILLSENAKAIQNVALGDDVTITLPNSVSMDFTVSGFTENPSTLLRWDATGAFVSKTTYQSILQNATGQPPAPDHGVYYVQFDQSANMRAEINEIKQEFHLSETQVGENVKLLGVMGQSGSSYIMMLYAVAVILFLLVMTAGILMIAGSLNSNVAQRTQFFGMLRCLGASKKQIIRFVRLEALRWCCLAIPLGAGAGVAVVWVLCALLRFLSPVYFSGLPAFGVSPAGILSGAIVGLLTVYIASGSPAKRASRVSPLTAASGGAALTAPAFKEAVLFRPILPRFFKVETALGIYHARASKKNFLLMTSSFTLSIILFLSFSTLVNFMGHAIRPLRPYTPDLSYISPDNTLSIDPGLAAKLSEHPAVKRAYGRMFAYGLPARADGNDIRINLISYEEHQFRWAGDTVVDGALSTLKANENAVLSVYHPDSPLPIGSQITLESNGGVLNLNCAGVLSTCPFTQDAGTENVICTEDTFRRLTGASGYTIMDLQLKRDATENDVKALRDLAGPDIIFSDQRTGNAEARGAYWAMALFIYGFLAVIALITVFNIINSIAMSVSARTRQYGALRAIGMSSRQLVLMVTAEAASYAVCGSITGCAVGLPLHKYLYETMVTAQWGEPWTLPIHALSAIVLIVLVTAIIAVLGPVRRIHAMSIVDTINAT